MWWSHEERNGFLTGWQAKINSCGISGPAGPLEQEMIKRSHEGLVQPFYTGIFCSFSLEQVLKDKGANSSSIKGCLSPIKAKIVEGAGRISCFHPRLFVEKEWSEASEVINRSGWNLMSRFMRFCQISDFRDVHHWLKKPRWNKQTPETNTLRRLQNTTSRSPYKWRDKHTALPVLFKFHCSRLAFDNSLMTPFCFGFWGLTREANAVTWINTTELL